MSTTIAAPAAGRTLDVRPTASPAASTALLTDQYELTMLRAAIANGTAQRYCVFEAFARHLPRGRRYGVVAGLGRILEAVESFTFSPDQVLSLLEREVIDIPTARWLSGFRFTGTIDGYPEGELYVPGSPVLHRRGHLRRVRAAGDADPQRSSTTTSPSPPRPPAWSTPPTAGR